MRLTACPDLVFVSEVQPLRLPAERLADLRCRCLRLSAGDRWSRVVRGPNAAPGVEAGVQTDRPCGRSVGVGEPDRLSQPIRRVGVAESRKACQDQPTDMLSLLIRFNG
jgi:hypothetical protein